MNDTNTTEDRFVDVAKVGRAHGVMGESRVFLINPDSEALAVGTVVRWTGKRNDREMKVTALRQGSGHLLARFSGVEGRDAAMALTSGMLAVRRSVLPALDDDELYLSDLVGLTVLDGVSGEQLGKVERLGETNVAILDIALDRGGSVLVPYIDAYVGKVDLDARTVEVVDLDHWLDE